VEQDLSTGWKIQRFPRLSGGFQTVPRKGLLEANESSAQKIVIRLFDMRRYTESTPSALNGDTHSAV
jgi:hypothetical protein